jgi:hypothetical protein
MGTSETRRIMSWKLGLQAEVKANEFAAFGNVRSFDDPHEWLCFIRVYFTRTARLNCMEEY